MEITYIGHTLSAEGARPDQEKIKAITEIPAPVDKKGVQRLLGTVNYLAHRVPGWISLIPVCRLYLFNAFKSFEQL
jgi:hypothetical protein